MTDPKTARYKRTNQAGDQLPLHNNFLSRLSLVRHPSTIRGSSGTCKSLAAVRGRGL